MERANPKHYFYFQQGRESVSFKELENDFDCVVGNKYYIFFGNNEPFRFFEVYGNWTSLKMWLYIFRSLESLMSIRMTVVEILANTGREIQYMDLPDGKIRTLFRY